MTAIALTTLLACGDDSTGTEGTSAVEMSTSTTTVESGAPSGETVSLQEAEQAALDAVGEGRVTWSGPEDDRGAAWEIEITRPDGTEADVLVAADGSVVKIVERFGQGPPLEGPGEVRSGGAVSLQEAEQAALDAVGGGRVTWSGPEDDRGAAWEIEITRPDGSEIDVLVAPDGSIVG